MAAASGARRVVIVGGGFAGLFAVRALRRDRTFTIDDLPAADAYGGPAGPRHPVDTAA